MEVKEKDLELLKKSVSPKKSVAIAITEIEDSEVERQKSGDDEFDMALGGGIVGGSMVLIGGSPGVGKSTLLLKIAGLLAKSGKKVLYAAGEESNQQIKLRASRLSAVDKNLFLLNEIEIGSILEEAAAKDYSMIIVDSIQTMYSSALDSAPGSVSQVKEITFELMRFAKTNGIAVFIIGHITKEGSIAGPRVLEHMVDTVLYFDGDGGGDIRILRSFKNRFGSTNEIGVFEMQQSGLSEVENPSEYMLNGRPENASGSVVVCLLEGTRPIMVEIQALVCDSNFGMARRTAAGTDYNRVNLLMAVLEKRAGIHMSGSEAYVNVAGGIKVSEPALDLGIVMALVSSFKNRAIDEKTVIFGEVGLAGEVRAVSQAQQRVNEAVKLGFKTCILPGVCLKNIKKNDKIEINENIQFYV